MKNAIVIVLAMLILTLVATVSPRITFVPKSTVPAATAVSTYKYKSVFVKCDPSTKLTIRGWVFNGGEQMRGIEVRVFPGSETSSGFYSVKTGTSEAEGYYSIEMSIRYLLWPLYIGAFENGNQVSQITHLDQKFNPLSEGEEGVCQRMTVNFQANIK